MSLPITFIFKSKKEVSLSEVFALLNWSSSGYISGVYFSNSGLSMVNILSRYREVSLNTSMRSWRLDLWRSYIKSLSQQYKNKSAISGAHLVPIGIPTICWYTMPSNCTYMFSMRKVKASHNSAHDQHLYEWYFLLLKNHALSEVQR